MPFLGEIAALTAAFLWGGTVLIFEMTGKKIGAFNTNLIRIIIGLVFLCLTLYVNTGYFFPVFANSDQIFWLGLSGIVGLALGDGCLFLSLVHIGSRRATLLLSLAPAMTTILAWFLLNEQLGFMALVGISLTVFGIFWVVYEKNAPERTHGNLVLGVIFGIIAAIGQAAGVIFVKYGMKTEFDSLSATILRMTPAAITLFLAGFFSGKISQIPRLFGDKKTTLYMIIGSISGPFLGVWLALVAVKYTQAGIASTLLATVPIIVIPGVVIVYKIKPSLRAVLGACIAVLGVALLFLRKM